MTDGHSPNARLVVTMIEVKTAGEITEPVGSHRDHGA